MIVWDSIYRDGDDSHAEDIYGEYDYTFVTGHVPVQKIYLFYEGDDDFDRLEMHRHGNLFWYRWGLCDRVWKRG